MKNEATNPPAVQCSAGSNTGDSSVGTSVARAAVVVAEPKLRALRSIAVVVSTLSDVLQAQIDLTDVEAERFSSLIGGLYDVLDEAGGSPAERSEAERGSLSMPRHHELIEALAADVNTTVAALENMRAAFRRQGDQRDRMKAALEMVRDYLGARVSSLAPFIENPFTTLTLEMQVIAAVKGALDPAPLPRDEFPPFDASDYERPKKPPAVIVLGPVDVLEVTR